MARMFVCKILYIIKVKWEVMSMLYIGHLFY